MADYTIPDRLWVAQLSRLIAENPSARITFNRNIEPLSAELRAAMQRAIFQCPLDDPSLSLAPQTPAHPGGLISADTLLQAPTPEPVWIVPGVIPSGLTILAGAPKVGKSWLALQIALGVASGGKVFGRDITPGPVLYLALEDPPRRLKERMTRQGWPLGLAVDFLPLGLYMDGYGDLRSGGSERLAGLVAQGGYRLVVIDTLSRALSGDQNDVDEMTRALTPLQELAHAGDRAIVIVDHHRKPSAAAQDAISDILGSTGKGAMADTILGLYRERAKAGARLAVTGRDVDEQFIPMRFDQLTSCWQLVQTDNGPTEPELELLDILVEMGHATDSQIAKLCMPERLRSTVHRQMARLESIGRVRKRGEGWALAVCMEDETEEPL